MALGETSNQYFFYPNIMKPTKDLPPKKTTRLGDDKTPPIEEHSSLLFAMRSAFREKLALQMNAGAQKQKNRSKLKQVENENSLLQLCEKNKKLMQDFNENSKENARRKIVSDHANRMKKLPPISHQNKSNSDVILSKVQENSVAMDKSKSTAGRQHHVTSPLKNNGYNTMTNGKNKLLSISSHQTLDRNLDESPPDMTKLRIVRNKRKHELMKVNTKHSSPVAMTEEEVFQPETVSHKTLLREKPKQKRTQNVRNPVSTTKVTPATLLEAEYESDFQKWQKERDNERQMRLAKLSIANNSGNAPHDPVVKPPISQAAARQDFDEFKQFPAKPVRKNVKRRQEHISVSPSINHLAEIDNSSRYPKQNKADFFTKPMRASPDLRSPKFNEKNIASPILNPASVIPGLHRPVLVRHDGRSNASSRTSTRNAFYPQAKLVPPMEGEREVLEKIPKTDSQHLLNNAAKGGYVRDYNSGAIPEQEENVILLPCRICGRKFRAERIDKHVAVCSKSSTKKRKVFNMSTARKKGTDLEKFSGPRGRPSRLVQPQPKKNNWRNQHEDFIKTIRHAKMVSSYVKGGGNLSDLPPPEPSANPDYVTCDFCKRRFAPHVAERHISKCKDIKARPPPPPKSRMPRNKH